MAEPTQPDLDQFLRVKPQPRWRKWLKWALIALGVVLLGLAVRSCVKGGDAPQYVSQAVEQAPLTVTVSATGKLAPTNQVEVGSQLSGLVTQVVADVNDRVIKGQPLALIDPEQLDDAIRQGQAQVNANRAQVATAEATLNEARAQLQRLEDVRRLSGGRVPSATELQTQQAAVQRAVAGVRQAQANVEASRAQLNSSQTQRYRAIIRSPVNGVVLARQVEPGQTVAASFNTPTLFVIAEDLRGMKLEVAIDEADVGQVQNGQRADFTVDAFPGETFPARITRVDLGSNLSAQTASSTTSTATTTGQVVSYAATLSVANPNLKLRPGMTATAEIVTLERPRALLIPNAALRFRPSNADASASGGGLASAFGPPRRRRGGGAGKAATIGRGSQQTVYIVGQDGKPQPVQITTGNSNGAMTEVTGGGLRPGMKVITAQLADENSKAGSAKGGASKGGGAPRG
ncbi:secretion protein HlyD [Sphingomonas sp. Leaf407]|uniref:efflux RND transporter periplasmic adaptor subunit n=1 Tax=unclassified Sphingomonas TaxID=196159 RepID=UPI0006F24A74|nr:MULTISPECIES: efflux RND transporter periplasmic adaptor subunit [unclassified Sphingomonas]KQN36566.1 secretion protein HlyD [Sphingomonas sp. Leaf42]KQT27188.1 secretion protein HlyD [Sphingomonas sp. Leaf407]